MARRDDRAYREYLREEQRSQPGCPARELCHEPWLRDTLGLVGWRCNYTMAGLSEVGGGGLFGARCGSDRVNGKKVSGSVAGSFVAISCGSPISVVNSDIMLYDGSSEPDANNLAG